MRQRKNRRSGNAHRTGEDRAMTKETREEATNALAVCEKALTLLVEAAEVRSGRMSSCWSGEASDVLRKAHDDLSSRLSNQLTRIAGLIRMLEESDVRT